MVESPIDSKVIYILIYFHTCSKLQIFPATFLLLPASVAAFIGPFGSIRLEESLKVAKNRSDRKLGYPPS